MTPLEQEFQELAREHRVLTAEYGRIQMRCTEELSDLRSIVARLQAEAIRLRADVIRRDTALAWAAEDREKLERAIPGLARRVSLARQVEVLGTRIQDLIRERGRDAAQQWSQIEEASVQQPGGDVPDNVEDEKALEASLGAADLVICQTGCLSHGEYWRVQDHCKRTGRACMLVERPEAIRIVRIHGASDGAGAKRIEAIQALSSPD